MEVSQSVEVPQSDTSLDDLPEFKDILFDDDDDGLEMYDEEPAEENTIFKDLDLNENTDSIGSSVNMDVFDESNLEELTLDEDTEIEDDESEEISFESSLCLAAFLSALILLNTSVLISKLSSVSFC